MKRIALLTALAAVLLAACGEDEGPVGTRGVRYWDIAWSSPDTILTDIEMLSEKSGWACGYRYNMMTGVSDGLIYRYDGESWTVALFLAGESGAKLTAIDFLGEKNGWAVGVREGGEQPGPAVFHYDGETWAEVTTEGLNGGTLKLLAVTGDNDVWTSDGINAFHFDGGWWSGYPLSISGPVDSWVFPNAEAGWAVCNESGYCYAWKPEAGGWILEPHPLYDVSSFYFKADGSGYYADYVNIPPVTERADIYRRLPGEQPSYERVYASDERRRLTACDHFEPDYFFFAGPNAAFEITGDDVNVLGYVPPGELGVVRAISVAAKGDVWGVMGERLDSGPSFIVHKK